MTRDAEKHLKAAEGYLAKGEGFYRKAAQEIVAAQEADPTLSNREVGERLGRSRQWVQKVVAWSTTDSAPSTPFVEPTRETTDIRGAKRVMREAPMEQVEQVIAELPAARQKQIAAAAGHEYLKARQVEDEKIRDRTPAQQKAIDAAKEQITLPVRKATAGFVGLGIQGHLEQATEELRELVEDDSLTAEVVEGVAKVTNEFVTELKVAIAMVGLDDELVEEVSA